MPQKITENFSYYEFRPKAEPSSWMPASEYQKMLLDALAGNLQIVRNELPEGSSMKITSGVRTMDDYDRLIASGYHPSSTSDHFCGTAVQIPGSSSKFKKYGDTYNFALGAADIVPAGVDVFKLFQISVNLAKTKKCHFGQVIYEESPASGAKWVHYGNCPTPFLTSEMRRFLGRTKFLQSLDGGKTYTVIETI